MKKAIALTIPAILFFGVLTAQTMFHDKPSLVFEKEGAVVTVQWEESEFDFSTVDKGTPISHTFTFTNTGNADLMIESVKPSCGCTVADYSKDPIPPGEAGFITATYNAAREGVFTKSITVRSNATEKVNVLKIRGEVR